MMEKTYDLSSEAIYETNIIYLNNEELINLSKFGVKINWDRLIELVNAYKSGLYECSGVN